jgi:hypothetical protein
MTSRSAAPDARIAYLPKPFQPRVLGALVRKTLDAK